MAELAFVLLALAVAFVLTMKRAPLWAYALLAVAVTFVMRTGLVHGDMDYPDWGFLGELIWLPAVALSLLSTSGELLFI